MNIAMICEKRVSLQFQTDIDIITFYENVIHSIKTLKDMETVETGIAEADMTNLMLTNRITTFFKI